MNLASRLVLLTILAARAAVAVTIIGYDPASFDRFASGYAGAPAPNTSPSFIGSGYDFSGVGWSAADPTKSFAMISDQYFVYAAHYGSASSIDFFSPALYAANPSSPAAAVVSLAVDAGFSFQPVSGTLGAAGDLMIGRLQNAISSSLGITSYPVLQLDTAASYSGLPLLVYGHGAGGAASPRIGTNVLDGIFGISGAGLAPSVAIGYDFDASPAGEALLEGGDSGSPTFVPWQGRLALAGTHSAIGQDSTTQVYESFDTLTADYLGSMAAKGIPFTTVPEPSRLILAAAGIAWLWLRRRRNH